MNIEKLQALSAQIRSNRIFEAFVVIVILVSALVIGARTYEITERNLSLIVFLDWSITFIFLVEIVIRFMAEERKQDFFKSGWNIFDTLIVLVSLIPIEGSELALIGRLVRIFRVLRMISIVPELRMLINSLFKALPQLAYVLMLMFIIFYIYAAIGATFFHDINPDLWDDISISMLTLFRVMTFEDWTDVMYETMAVYPLSWIYYLSFIFLTAFAFLNMVIGIVVNVMEDEHAQQQLEQDRIDGVPTLLELSQQIEELKQLVRERNAGNSPLFAPPNGNP